MKCTKEELEAALKASEEFDMAQIMGGWKDHTGNP